jgi:hypothetical protein
VEKALRAVESQLAARAVRRLQRQRGPLHLSPVVRTGRAW